MRYHIRPFDFSQADYKAAVNLRNTLYPDTPSTVQIWQYNDVTRRQDRSYRFYIAETAGKNMVAFAQCIKTHAASDTLNIGLVGRPFCWTNGVMGELMNWILQSAEQLNATSLTHKVQESDQAKYTFLIDQGFTQVMKYPVSALRVAQFRDWKWQEKIEQTAALGIEIKQLPANWHYLTQWQTLIHALDWELIQNVPHHEKRQQEPLEEFVQSELHHPNAWPESYFLAWHEGLPVGMTCLVKRGGRIETVATALTGVVTAYRRKGIATALKYASIQFAKTNHVQTILTNNEEHNPMFVLNQKLGFVSKPAWVDMKLKL